MNIIAEPPKIEPRVLPTKLRGSSLVESAEQEFSSELMDVTSLADAFKRQ